MGTSSRAALSGPGRGCGGRETQGCCRAAREAVCLLPGLPASPRSRMIWGHWCQLGGDADPVLSVPAPSPPCLLAHSTGAPFTEHPLVATASCAPGHSPPHGTDTLVTAWHSLSCLGTHQHHSSRALEQSRANISLGAGPGWFWSWHCCSSSAEEESWRQLLHCHGSSSSLKQPQVMLRRWIWTQNPLIQAMAAPRKPNHTRQLQQKKED